MPDLTLDEYRKWSKKDLHQVLKQEALRISGEPPSKVDEMKPSLHPDIHHVTPGQFTKRQVTLRFLLGFFSIFRPKTSLSNASMGTSLRP